MEISRKKQREQVLSRFNYIRTCVLARELCLLIRQNRASLSRQDVSQSCKLISQLCKETGCVEPSRICTEAADTVVKDEQGYLELCKQSCLKCGESRRPSMKRANAATNYVA